MKIFCIFVGLWVELYTSNGYSLIYVNYTSLSIFFQIIKPYRLWASLIAQLVETPPAMQETPGSFLGQEDLLKKG